MLDSSYVRVQKRSMKLADLYRLRVDEDGVRPVQVPDSLDLYAAPIRRLPDRLWVRGYLDLTLSAIEYLPEYLRIDGALILDGTRIPDLPRGLWVRENLDLRRTSVVMLGADMRVDGTLDLEGRPVEKVPSGLLIGGNLIVRNTLIRTLPADCYVRGQVHGLPRPAARIYRNGRRSPARIAARAAFNHSETAGQLKLDFGASPRTTYTPGVR